MLTGVDGDLVSDLSACASACCAGHQSGSSRSDPPLRPVGSGGDRRPSLASRRGWSRKDQPHALTTVRHAQPDPEQVAAPACRRASRASHLPPSLPSAGCAAVAPHVLRPAVLGAVVVVVTQVPGPARHDRLTAAPAHHATRGYDRLPLLTLACVAGVVATLRCPRSHPLALTLTVAVPARLTTLHGAAAPRTCPLQSHGEPQERREARNGVAGLGGQTSPAGSGAVK